MRRLCTVEGCDHLHYGHGLCAMYYQRVKNHGTTELAQPYRPPHGSPAECDRWMPTSANGCPHFTDAHVDALKAAGQWPTTATPVWGKGYEAAS